MLNIYANVSQTQENVLKNLKNARLLGEVVGHLQQLDDEASYYLLEVFHVYVVMISVKQIAVVVAVTNRRFHTRDMYCCLPILCLRT
jgi:hypothetical protein